MEKMWANVGIDLHVELAGSRLRAALENALREAVRVGRLRAGTRLPSSRALAADLGIARNTVADAYDQLVAEGWLTARTGSGTWVADRRVPALQPDSPALSEITFHRYDLRPGVPDLSAFPRREWLATARSAVNAAPAHVLGYPDPRGLPQLRVALAAYLARARGVSADPGRIVICAGFAHGLALLCQVLRARGATTIAMEAYGHQTHCRLAQAQGLSTALLPVDAGGAVLGRVATEPGEDLGGAATPGRKIAAATRPGRDPSATTRPGPNLSAATPPGRDPSAATPPGRDPSAATPPGRNLSGAAPPGRNLPSGDLQGGDVSGGLGAADAALLTPAHQFPLGVTLKPRRRRAAVQWAINTGGLVIEDDYDGEFRYDRQPVGAMQALAPDHVVYAGTASKSLAPGLRLGWLVLPTGLFDDVVAAKESSGTANSSLEQLTLAEFITSGAYDRQVRHARLAYRRRRDRMVSALHQHAPQVRVTGIAAGLHALLRLPETYSEDDIIARAWARGLAVEGLASYRAAGNGASPAVYGHGPAHSCDNSADSSNSPIGSSHEPADSGHGAAHSRHGPTHSGHGPTHSGHGPTDSGQVTDPHGPALIVGYGRPADHAFTTALARLCAVLSEVGQ